MGLLPGNSLELAVPKSYIHGARPYTISSNCINSNSFPVNTYLKNSTMGYRVWRSQSIRKYKSNKVIKAWFIYSTHIHPAFYILGNSLTWRIQRCVTQHPLSSRRSQTRGEHKHTSTKDIDAIGKKAGDGNVTSSKETVKPFWEEETLELRSERRMMRLRGNQGAGRGKCFRQRCKTQMKEIMKQWEALRSSSWQEHGVQGEERERSGWRGQRGQVILATRGATNWRVTTPLGSSW